MVASGEINLANYKEWLNEIKSKLKSTRATTGGDVAVVPSSVLNIPQKVTSTTSRWAFKRVNIPDLQNVLLSYNLKSISVRFCLGSMDPRQKQTEIDYTLQ